MFTGSILLELLLVLRCLLRVHNHHYITLLFIFQSVIVQDPVPGRVKTVTPYFDKMPSVIITKTQH